MLNRKVLASAAATALLVCTGHFAQADFNQPLTLQASADKPLMVGLDRIGLGAPLRNAGLTVGGLAETSWTISDSSPPDNNITGRIFDFDNQYLTLNQIDLFIERTVDPAKGQFDVGGRFEMIYGADARGIHSLGLFDYYGYYNVPSADDANSPHNQLDIVQAYVDFAVPVGNGLKICAGKFVTHMGYEVINPSGNALYSHSYLFGYAIPFTHTGVMATYTLSPQFSIMGGISRGWDTSLEDDNDTIDTLGQFVWTIDDRATFYVNLVTGPDQPGDNDNWRTVVDLIYTRKLSKELSMAVNGDYGYQTNANGGSDAQWYGTAGYLTYTINDQFSTTGRLEWFNDQDGYRGLGTNVYEATLGLAIKPFAADAIGQNLVIRPEVRFDYADDRTFDGGTDRTQATFGIDAFFTF